MNENIKQFFKVTDKRRYYRTEYLKSDHWKELRKKKITECPKCDKCPATKYLDVHHLNYKNLFDVELTDLQVLCRKCHVKEHAEERQKKKKEVIKTPKIAIAPPSLEDCIIKKLADSCRDKRLASIPKRSHSVVNKKQIKLQIKAQKNIERKKAKEKRRESQRIKKEERLKIREAKMIITLQKLQESLNKNT